MSLGWYKLRFTDDPTKVKVACEECGRSIWFPLCQSTRYRCCGADCNQLRRDKLREKRRRECETCGKTFYPRTVQIRNGVGNFCSHKCNTAGRAALLRSLDKAAEGWRRAVLAR